MEFKETVLKFQSALLETIEPRKDGPVLLLIAVKTFPASLPRPGYGLNATASHLINDISPGLSCSSLSPRYYGFITGGCTAVAFLADNLVSAPDQNVQTWRGIFTSGFSVSNLMAIACGQEYGLAKRGATDLWTIGLMEARVAAGVNNF
ncbi:tyrosine decarboxylase [Penicillium cinerascens]|uniref:Tyrosine decarboxylase n=1 Tax=Penicillium cinerascens TaxID=70096 RepID=A0A9W9M645_9EURO|nr:tyrosine decarboxylase [Penicillium cinerascens]KAJ5190134.1 tyrosine decarboxylase [Penicillium cinerascens]